jgi:mRNA interferase MazF
VNRGEVWTAAGGVYASKPRPVLIIQDDRFNATGSVVIIPLTTRLIEAPFTRVPIEANEMSGIAEDSHAMVDKITTVRRSQLGKRTGRATPALMVDVERAVLVFLGLAG